MGLRQCGELESWIHNRGRAALLVLVVALCGCNWTERVSMGSQGEQGIAGSSAPVISGDGRFVAFESRAHNLFSPDPNNPVVPDPNAPLTRRAYLHDTATGVTSRLDFDLSGAPLESDSASVVLSADGQTAAYHSIASNVVANDFNGHTDVFVRNIAAGTNERVSVDSAGDEAGSYSKFPALSADGQRVAFLSIARNLIANDTTFRPDVYLHDRTTGVTEVVSVSSSGVQAVEVDPPEISGDGRFVAFATDDENVVANDNNGRKDVFVRDTLLGETTRVSVDSGGVEANDSSWRPALSFDGRFVAFQSKATSLVAGAGGSLAQIYLHDRATGQTTLISQNAAEEPGDGSSVAPTLSADGRYVGYRSFATNLTTDGLRGIFVFDRANEVTSLVSRTMLGDAVDEIGGHPVGEKGIAGPSLSEDGRYIAFGSPGSTIVPDDSNEQHDVFIRTVPRLVISEITPASIPIGSTTAVTITGENFFSDAKPAIAAPVTGIVVVDENTITLNVTVPASAEPGSLDVIVFLPGREAGPLSGASVVCSDCLSVF